MSRQFSSNLSGKVRNFSLPKNRPLVPLYEAIVNSINAIDERAKNQGDYQGIIEIEILRENTLFGNSDNSTVCGFCVRDNGIGFNEENMNSFMEADSEYKLAIGGKGVGRFSWLKAFSSVQIVSTYKDTSGFVTRSFTFSLDSRFIEDKLKDTPICMQCVILHHHWKGFLKECLLLELRIILEHIFIIENYMHILKYSLTTK